MTSKRVYNNSKLDFTTESIRLAQIVYSNRQDGSYIQLKLQKFLLSSIPPFYALSYVWGPSIPRKTIVINGEKFEIRENLWHFLWQASIPEGCQYLWIDALCINQEDINERNHQVKIMQRIYSRASIVLVWLGVAAENSDMVMDLMETCGVCVDPVIQDHLEWYARIIFDNQDLKQFDQSCIAVSSSISKLFEREYWRRMWIVQELCMAKDCRILCGTKIVELISLMTLWHSSASLHGNDSLSPILRLVARPLTGKIPSYYLRDLLIETKSQKSEDKHDRIYALLGLLKDDAHDVPIDYTCKMVDLYAQVLRSMLIFDGGSVSLPMKLDRLRESLSISESDETAKLETKAFLSCCERLTVAADDDTRLWHLYRKACNTGTASEQAFRRQLLEVCRSGGREFNWTGETIELEPYTVELFHEHRMCRWTGGK